MIPADHWKHALDQMKDQQQPGEQTVDLIGMLAQRARQQFIVPQQADRHFLDFVSVVLCLGRQDNRFAEVRLLQRGQSIDDLDICLMGIVMTRWALRARTIRNRCNKPSSSSVWAILASLSS